MKFIPLQKANASVSVFKVWFQMGGKVFFSHSRTKKWEIKEQAQSVERAGLQQAHVLPFSYTLQSTPPPLEPPWPYCHTFSTPVDSLNYFPHRHPVALPRLPLQKVLIRSRLVALPSDSQAGASALPRLHGGSPAHLLGPCERTAAGLPLCSSSPAVTYVPTHCPQPSQ